MKNFRHVNRCLAPGAGARFASFPIRDRKGARHRAQGRDLPAFRFEIAKVPGTGREGEICQHFDSGIAKVPGTGREDEICQHSDSGIEKVPG